MWSLEENKVATTIIDYSHRGVDQLCREVVTDDYIGPLLNVRDLKQISSTYDCRYDYDQRVEERRTMIKTLHEKRMGLGTYEGDGEQFESIYDDAKDDLLTYETKRQEEYSQRQKERSKKRIEKLRDIHGKLMDLLEDHECQEIALDCTWTEDGYYTGVSYSCVFVQDILSSLIDAPSGYTTKRLKMLANKIKGAFDLLDEKEFFSFEFLSQDDPFESALRTYCLSDQLTKKQLFSELHSRRRYSVSSSATETPFIQQIREDRLSEALYMSLHRHDAALQQVFASSRADVDDIAGFDMDDFRSLAKTIWEFKTSRRGRSWDPRTKEDIKTQLTESTERYDAIKENIITFLNKDTTRDFLDLPSDPEDLRRDVLRLIFTKRDLHSFLFTECYMGLRRKLEHIYRNPEDYDL